MHILPLFSGCKVNHYFDFFVFFAKTGEKNYRSIYQFLMRLFITSD
jgi:hypothetical protein